MPADKLSKAEIISALQKLSDLLEKKQIIGELCIFGGAAMVLAFDARESTRDVDAIFVPKKEFLDASKAVSIEMGYDEHWLNDGVKGFVSEKGEVTSEGLPVFTHLRLVRPTTKYLLAMKCMASRIGDYDGAGDRSDIRQLCNELKISTVAEVLDIIESYYPAKRVLPISRYLLEEIIDEMEGLN